MIAEIKHTAAGAELFIHGVRVAIGDDRAHAEQIARLVNQSETKFGPKPLRSQGLWLCGDME
jgi:hypothetical protein